MTEAVAALQKSLAEASQALADGEAAEAERRARAITALVRAKRDAAEFAAVASADENDDDQLCEDLLRRLVRYAEADRECAPPEVLERIATEGLAG
jgi:N-acetylglutamate synthase-like GNAT family acetyltransferase